ncbi:hypothetical protein [Spirillospora sp. NPDC029432]|uniref:hypothetical protein n=1 Tax=Spirillospora sp. NPDC029432 TaxID=3154599 RepID=UPI003456A34F
MPEPGNAFSPAGERPGRLQRRQLLRAATVLAGTGGASALPSAAGTSAAAAPAGLGKRPTIVIVHGANGNAYSSPGRPWRRR